MKGENSASVRKGKWAKGREGRVEATKGCGGRGGFQWGDWIPNHRPALALSPRGRNPLTYTGHGTGSLFGGHCPPPPGPRVPFPKRPVAFCLLPSVTAEMVTGGYKKAIGPHLIGPSAGRQAVAGESPQGRTSTPNPRHQTPGPHSAAPARRGWRMDGAGAVSTDLRGEREGR